DRLVSAIADQGHTLRAFGGNVHGGYGWGRALQLRSTTVDERVLLDPDAAGVRDLDDSSALYQDGAGHRGDLTDSGALDRQVPAQRGHVAVLFFEMSHTHRIEKVALDPDVLAAHPQTSRRVAERVFDDPNVAEEAVVRLEIELVHRHAELPVVREVVLLDGDVGDVVLGVGSKVKVDCSKPTDILDGVRVEVRTFEVTTLDYDIVDRPFHVDMLVGSAQEATASDKNVASHVGRPLVEAQCVVVADWGGSSRLE